MAQNHNTTGVETQKIRVLRELDESPEGLESRAVADRLDHRADSLSGVRGTLSKLKQEGYVETFGNTPYIYDVTDAGRELLSEEESDDGDDEEGTGLAALFDSVDDGEHPGTNGGPPGADEERVEALEERLSAVEDAVGSNNVAREDLKYRLREVENRVCATGDGGGEASLCLPVADRDADLDHATVIYELGSRRKVRNYLRSLLGLPEAEDSDMTDSEQRANEESEVEVVEKQD